MLLAAFLKVVLSDTEEDEDLIHGDDEPSESPDDGARICFAVPPVAGAKSRRYQRYAKGDLTPEDSKEAKALADLARFQKLIK